ncbi:MAG: hypothetical protein ACRDNZ_24445, partial [Streptosporangiaceae bacterium]
MSLTADRRSTLLTFVSFGLRPAIPVGITYLIATLVNAAVARDSGTLIWTAAGVAVAAAIAAGSVPLSIELSVRMIEATSSLVDERLMRLTSGLPGVQELEDPALLDRLELLHQQRVPLAEGADAVSLVLGALVRAIATGVVLALVNPLMLATPLLAVPSLIASRRGLRRKAAAAEQAAAKARLGRHLYRTVISDGAAKELRLFDFGDVVRQRFAQTMGDADRAVTSVVARNLVPSGLAGLFFAAGYLGALLLVAHDFSRGGATLGDVVLVLGLVTSINLQVT